MPDTTKEWTCRVTHRARQLAVKLPAVAAGCCADGQADQAGLVVLDQVGHQELLRMHLQDKTGRRHRQQQACTCGMSVPQETKVCKTCAGAHSLHTT